MTARSPREPHRVSTPLELFFDLVFVVAISQAAAGLHHAIGEGHTLEGIVGYLMVFFAIWWAWMNFTWFASACDPDDALYRMAVFVQMAGVLVFAAGVPRFLEELDAGVVVAGYLVMRIGAVGQWLRAAAQDPVSRPSALRYAAGIAACQVGWLVLLATPDSWWIPGFVVLATCELAVPVWAERHAQSGWHPGHIGERYGLFTILVLGESVLSATAAMQAAVDAGGPFSDLVTTAIGGFLIVAAMWWVYFDLPVERLLSRARQAFSALEERHSFVWGYGHYFVFASAAAVGVGLAVAVDQAVGQSALTDLEAAFVTTLPVALFLTAVWVLHWRFKSPGRFRVLACPLTSAVVVATSWTGEPVLLTGLALAALVAASLLVHRAEADAGSRPTREAGAEGEPRAAVTQPATT